MDQSDEINQVRSHLNLKKMLRVQILICIAECEIKVIAMPSFSQLFIHKCEEIPLVKVDWNLKKVAIHCLRDESLQRKEVPANLSHVPALIFILCSL